MVAVPVTVVPLKYVEGEGQQIELKSTLMETVIVFGELLMRTVVQSEGVCVILALLRPALASTPLTALVTSLFVFPLITAVRAPTRAAAVSICETMPSRAASIWPKTSIRNTGATIAVSSAAAPERRRRNDLRLILIA
jgi:hypothetical protein